MKTKLWMLGAAVAALTSCTQSEVVEIPESQVIGFEPFVEKHTRAVQNISTVDQITYFNVFGYHADHTDGTPTGNWSEEFKNHYVELTTAAGGTTYWLNEKAGYWEANQLFRFAAYTNGSNEEKLTATYTPGEDVLKITGYSVTDASVAEPAEKPDLLAAISGDRITTSVDNNTDVVFNFRHMLTKVTLILYNGSTNMDLHYHDLNVENVYKTGDCNMKYNSGNILTTWDNLTSESVFSFGEEVVVPHPTAGSSTHSTEEVSFYIIPQSSEKTISFKTHQVDANGNQAYNKSHTANLSVATLQEDDDANWKPGYHYRYIINLGETGHTISFSVSGVQGWITDIDNSGSTNNRDYIALELTTTDDDNN